jgi:hypothetical protein
MVDTVVVTNPDSAIAVLQPTLSDAIAAAQLYAGQAGAAQAIVMAAQASINAAEIAALSAAASAQAAASAAAAAAGGGGISTTVAALYLLPGLTEGLPAWATNGRKVSEGPMNGTGIAVRYSLGFWRCVSTDAPVQT